MGWLLLYLSTLLLWETGQFRMGANRIIKLLFTRLWALSWAFRDGALPKARERLSNEQLKRQVFHLPTLLEFAGYVHFSQGCIMCPFFEFSDYINWIERKSHYKKLPARGYSAVLSALVRMTQAFACVFAGLVIEDELGFKHSFCGQEEFLTYGNFL